MRRVLLFDERPVRSDAFMQDLEAAGLDVTTDRDEHTATVAAIVVAIDPDTTAGLPEAVTAERFRELPIVAVAPGAGAECALQLAIDGAVCCLAGEPDAEPVAQAVEAHCGAEAPPLAEQRRQARVAALEAFVRDDRPGSGTPESPARRVRLTRLEHIPLPALPPEDEPPSWLEMCSPKQRELLDVVRRAGSVSKAAHVLGTSRSSIYTGLRRIAHRLRLRDSGDVLRLLGAMPLDDPA